MCFIITHFQIKYQYNPLNNYVFFTHLEEKYTNINTILITTNIILPYSIKIIHLKLNLK